MRKATQRSFFATLRDSENNRHVYVDESRANFPRITFGEIYKKEERFRLMKNYTEHIADKHKIRKLFYEAR